MGKCFLVFFSILLAGIVGMLIDSNLGLDGNFSIVMSLAVLGAFLIDTIENKKNTGSHSENDNTDE